MPVAGAFVQKFAPFAARPHVIYVMSVIESGVGKKNSRRGMSSNSYLLSNGTRQYGCSV